MLVSLMAGKAEVKYDSEVMNAAAVAKLIEDLGFGAKLIEDNAVTHGKLDLIVSQVHLRKHPRTCWFLCIRDNTLLAQCSLEYLFYKLHICFLLVNDIIMLPSLS